MAETKIRGITIQLGADVSGIEKGLKDINSKLGATQKELTDVNRLLKLDPSNTTLLAQKQELLAKQIAQTNEKLAVLHDTEKQLRDNGVDENSEQFRALQREIVSAEASLNNFEDQQKSTTAAQEKAADVTEKNAEKYKRFADAVDGANKLLVRGAELAATAAASVAVASVKQYADYEQLIGGVETLFKEGAEEVEKNAKKAYKTAGLSANNYLETVTSFSAALINSLSGDTKKAAKLADVAITDMSDNANKMGTDVSSLQSAYAGFAKQQYTLLDNLKLGYSGTKTGMEQLLADAEKISGIKYDISSYADIVQAIHVVQEEMGIAGTTAKEAEETISGSVNQTKAAFENLITGLGDANADIDELAGNAIDAAKTVARNVEPVIERVFINLIGEDATNTVERFGEITLKAAKWIINNWKPVATVVTTAVVAFNAFNAAIKISTAVSAANAAIKGLSGSVSAATKAQAAWNAVMSANPIGAVVTAVALLSAGLAVLIAKNKDATQSQYALTEEQKRENEQIRANYEALQEMTAASQEAAYAEEQHYDHVQSLWRELQTLADENGRVQEGYQERADFILGELNNALGTEYTQNEGIIQQYGDMRDEIDKLIEKKKAEAMLSAYQDDYANAIRGIADARNEATAKANELAEAEDKLAKAQAQYDSLKGMYESATDDRTAFAYKQQMNQALEDLQKAQKTYDELAGSASTAKDAFLELSRTISLYEEASAQITSGNTDAALKSLGKLQEGYKATATTVGASMEEQTAALKQAYVDASFELALIEQEFKNNSDNISDQQLADARQAAKDAYEAWRDVGVQTGEGFIKGIDDELRGVKSKVQQMMEAAENAAKKAADIRSPSHVWENEIGRPIPLGLARGVYKNIDKAEAAVAAMMEASKTDAQKYAVATQGAVSSIPQSIKLDASGVKLTQPQTNVSVNFTGSLASLASVLTPYIKIETNLIGPSAVEG